MLNMPPINPKNSAACRFVCGRIGAKIGGSASEICGICPATMIIPQMVHSAAMVAMSGKAS